MTDSKPGQPGQPGQSGQPWQPALGVDDLRRRAAAIAQIRAFFAARDVLEVDLPVLGRAGVTDAQLGNLHTRTADGARWALQTSTEAFSKRLLAAGAPSHFCISRALRDDPAARHHNPEFLLLEWYRLGFDAPALIAEVCALIAQLGGPARAEQVPYADLLAAQGLPANPDTTQILAALDRAGVDVPESLLSEPAAPPQRAQLLDLLISTVIQPGLTGLTVITQYPADQAVQAAIDADNPALSTRFEVFWDGVELANGWQECTDSAEMRRRFAQDQADRAALNLPPAEPDAGLLAALDAGLPPCSGVALGVDRLLMQLWGAQSLDAVMPFHGLRV